MAEFFIASGKKIREIFLLEVLLLVLQRSAEEDLSGHVSRTTSTKIALNRTIFVKQTLHFGIDSGWK